MNKVYSKTTVLTKYQQSVLTALRKRHEEGRPKPPCTTHAIVGTVGSPSHAGRALREMERLGLVRNVGNLDFDLWELNQ